MSPKRVEQQKLFSEGLQEDPITHLQMCQSCWNGEHTKGGCKQQGCECSCYDGLNASTTGLVKPRKYQDRLKVGTIKI